MYLSYIEIKLEPKESLNLTTPAKTEKTLTPREIVAELDKYVIGQNEAKKIVAIALRNRWRRLNSRWELREEIMPNNIIMIGPTGVGKTEIARRLAKLVNAPFVKVEATKYTEVGYVGRDVESMIRDLVERAVLMVREEKTKEKAEEAKKAVEERILDALIPRRKTGISFETSEISFQSDNDAREHLRQMLRSGALDNTTIEIEILGDFSPPMQIFGPFSLDDIGPSLQDMMSQIFPKKTVRRKMKISEAKIVLLKEESEKLVDMESVVKEASYRVEHFGIVFIDEIDKIASHGAKGNGPDVSREGVQRDLLPIVEGTTVNTRYGPVKTEHILFIASGAFHVAKPADLIPELQGRFPIRVELKSLTEDDFVKILTLPENALIKQYKALLESEGIELEFTPESIRQIAAIAQKVNDEVMNIGARRLHTIMTTLLEDILFNAPDNCPEKRIVVDKEMVINRLDKIIVNTDLRKYIL